MPVDSHILLLSRAAAILFAFIALSGCASAARPEKMTPDVALAAKAYPYDVSVKVLGGHATDPMWTSQISNEDFAVAVESALEKSKIFSRVNRGGSADKSEYSVEITLVHVDQPVMGLDMTINISATWRLVNCTTNTTMWKQDIEGTYTATVGQAFAAIERLQLANEGAARDNIKKGLAALSTAPLPEK